MGALSQLHKRSVVAQNPEHIASMEIPCSVGPINTEAGIVDLRVKLRVHLIPPV